MIVAKQLTKNYGDLHAVQDVSLEIAEGECVGLLGLNGAGKTTLLRMLACLLAPSSGSASLKGADVADGSLSARRILGFLPETPPLYGEMTVRRFLEFACKLREVANDQVEARVLQVAERCGVQKVLDQRIETLSFGYKKRVGIAQAIVHQPAVVILDEPIAGLDPAQIVGIRELIRSLHGQHTILLSSHILSEISQTCDRIFVMHSGRVAASGTEEELTAKMVAKRSIRLQVAGQRSKLEESLEKIDGIGEWRVTSESDSIVDVELDSQEDIRAALAKAVVEAGLYLLELARNTNDLESAFLELTGVGEDQS